MMSKSAGYCHSHLSDGTGLMLLCEVAAKPFHELVHSDYNADASCKNAGKRVTKGVGRVQPSGWKDAGEALENDALKGVQMPAGLPSNSDSGNYSLWYNEVRQGHTYCFTTSMLTRINESILPTTYHRSV